MSLKYIEQIKENVLAVDKNDLNILYEVLCESDCIIPYGSGRSYCSIKIPVGQLAKIYNNKIVVTPEDPGFPGNNMYEAAPKLEKRYKRIVLLINSGSGASQEPLAVAHDLARYIEGCHSKKFTILGITSDASSPIAKISQKHGYVIKLRGRVKDIEPIDYTTTGIMGDAFELGSLLLTQGVVKSIYMGEKSRIKDIHRRYFNHIDKLLNKYVESDLYDGLVENLAKRTNVFVGGRGGADEVAEMTVIRLFHVKYAIGDHVYQARGANTPRPRPGDIGILISCSGETPSVIRWANTLRKEKCIVYSIVRDPDSTLAKNSDYYISIEIGDDDGPRDFYMYAAYILSPLPIKLIGKLSSGGLILPERLLRYYHSTVE